MHGHDEDAPRSIDLLVTELKKIGASRTSQRGPTDDAATDGVKKFKLTITATVHVRQS